MGGVIGQPQACYGGGKIPSHMLLSCARVLQTLEPHFKAGFENHAEMLVLKDFGQGMHGVFVPHEVVTRHSLQLHGQSTHDCSGANLEGGVRGVRPPFCAYVLIYIM